MYLWGKENPMKQRREEKDEQQLIKTLQAGDTSAMKALYDLHIGYLTAVCARYISDSEDVKDVLQDGFVSIFRNIGKFSYNGTGSFRAWASRIISNTAIDFLRAHANTFLLDPEIDIPDEDAPEETPDTEEIPIEVIHEMISRLPAGYRVVFNLYVLEGKSHKEIAKTLDIKENSSASQLLRAKKQLAKWIDEYKEKRGRAK